MVFESVVADLLNRFLGTYIDNLNASQLNIGIWGGDVKLNHLEIRESALDDLDLPVKLKFGYLQNLILKIPWKNLYTAPTVVNISELYLIIVPNQGIIYNEEKRRKNDQEIKQKKLARLEENRKNRNKQEAQIGDTFTEKLVAQIIKNLQIRVKQVHVRYEDKFSNRDRPFATGVTLDSLEFQTTDENFKLTIQREAVKIFYKLISMNHFSLYSNSNTGLISDMDKNAIIEVLRNSVATKEKRPEGYRYMLEPLTIEAKLKLNQKPEADDSDWTIPKIDLSMQLDKLAFAIGKFQYQDFLLFLEAQERFHLSERFLKYRPNLTDYKGHYKEWWLFAYNSILHEQVKRRRNNWSWSRIREHRKMVRKYKDAWIVFRTEKNPSASIKQIIEESEEKLDVFNLNIARQQAEFDIDRREGLVRVEDQPEQGWVGWAKSWFGGGAGGVKKAESEMGEADAKIIEKIEQAMTPEEKEHLFEAIDYQENMPPTDYPKHYVENLFNLTLSTVVVALEDVLEMRFTDLSADLGQRPSANAMKFETCVKKLEMNAFDKGSSQSMLTMTDSNRPWLSLQFETNPMEGDYDQAIELAIAPIMIKCHAPAVNRALEVFKPPESVRLHQLTTLAIARYEDVKARSATALQHMVEVRKRLKLEVQIDPATIVLSAGGVFDEAKPALIADLGQLKVKTLDSVSEKAYQHIGDPKLRSLVAKAYDNFQLSLTNVQLIFADSFQHCMRAHSDRYSCHHLLKPTGMTVDLMRSTIDDIQLPLFRLFGELPDVVLMISDDRLAKLLELINSVPRPEFDEEVVDLSAPVEVQGPKLRDRAKMMAIMEVNELDGVSMHDQKNEEEGGEAERKDNKQLEKGDGGRESPVLREQQIQLDMNLILNEVGIIVNTKNRPFISAHIRRLGLNFRKKMFDMVAQAHLGSLTLEMPQIDGGTDTIYLIENQLREGGDNLIDITYRQASEESPTFRTEFSSNEQSIDFIFQILNFNLHKDVLNELKNFNDRLQKKLAQVPPPQSAAQNQPSAMSSKKRTPSQSSKRSRESSIDRKSTIKKKMPRRPSRPVRQKKFVFKFLMHEISAKLYARQNDILGGIDPDVSEDAILEFCALNIQKMNMSGRILEDGSMNVDIGLNAFTMDDRRKNAKIQRLMDKKNTKSTEKFIAVKYNQNTNGDKFVDVLSSQFYLMLAPEFLGVLSSFFNFHTDIDDDEEEEGNSQLSYTNFATPAQNTSKLPSGPGSSPAVKMASAQQAISKAAPEQIVAPAGTLALNCKIYAIEVILIENSIRPDDSQAMILSFDAFVDAKNAGGVQRMDGGIRHLKVYSTYFATNKRHLSNYPILKELDIRFTGSIDEENHSQKFEVSMDQVAIRVSPSVIRLLSAVSAQFSEHQKKDQAAKTARAAFREYTDYWKPKRVEREKFWWFQTQDDSNVNDENIVDEVAEDAEQSRELVTNQQAHFSINRFVVTVEAGTKEFTRPMILLESVLHGSAQNWTTNLMANAEARLQISYYNEAFNIWEPVIEPVLHQHEGWQSWQLKLLIGSQEEEEEPQQAPSTSSSKAEKKGKGKEKAEKKTKKKAVPPPKMAVLIEACEVMNITVTKSFLQLLNQLSDSFEKAAKQITPPMSRQLPGVSSYLLLNDTGLPIKVQNTGTLKVSDDKNKPVDCPVGKFIEMERIEQNNGGNSEMKGGNWQMTEDQRQVELYLQLSEPATERKVNILRAEIQCIDLPEEAYSGKKLALIVDTRLENARHVVTLRSLVTIVNHLDVPVELQSIKDEIGTFCGVATSIDEPLNLQLRHLYTPDGDFKIRPLGGAYEWSENFSWHEFAKVKRRTVRCDQKEDTKKGFFIEMVVTREKICRSPRSQECQTYNVHLFPPIHFVNTLPIGVNILEPIEKELLSGDGIDLFNLIAGVPFVLMLEYIGETYKLKMTIPTPEERADLHVIQLHSTSNTKQLCLGISWSTEFLRSTMTLYTPYWMVNETGKEVVYKQGNSTDIGHLPTKNPHFLPLGEADFFEKKKAKLRFTDSEWSADFPLDTAGSGGQVVCKSGDREYELTIDVQLCQSGLTKVVTISPFYLLQNESKVAIEVREPNRKDQWIKVPPESVIGFWPQQKNKRKTLIARFPNTQEESVQFPFTESFEGFARIGNNLIGLYVIVSLSDDSSVIHMEQFVPGMTPAILMNATDFPVEYWQSGLTQKRTLPPGQMIPFAWDDIVMDKSTDIPRLEWNSGDGSGSDMLLHNRDQSYLPSSTSNYHYCVSFLNGRQRVFLFTSDPTVSLLALQAYEMEQPNMEVEFRLHGVGISLVNNIQGIEVLFGAISSSYTKEGQSSKDGFWMQYRQTDHQTTVWVKLHNFQIDNQLTSAVFPCMLGMVPQPRSVVKNEPKPFLELSFVMNQSEHTKIAEIKLLEMLIQEFAIRLDQSLINEILDLFPRESIETDYNKETFTKDLELTRNNLNKRAVQTRVTQAKAFYERMHISPLMMHLSFSQGHVGEKGDKKEMVIGIQWEFLNLMLKSVGVTLTEIQDVTFKLAFFHREATFYNRSQLQADIQSHYIRQFIKQAYVLVLGLDILGNPFGLIRDLSTGVQDFFYQPIQGAVTGPLEFVEGMTLGVHSLFSHSVGGVLGVASRITGTLGKGVAALTLDDEYQRKRLQTRQQPANFGEGMFRGVRGLGSGVVEGVTGVVSKPLEGAKKGGFTGFIKGTGKGLIGAVVRPVSGVVDMATSVADSVKTVVTNTEEIRPIRPPRVISSDKIIRPFVFEEAIGYKIFREINKGDFAETDFFLTHGLINKHLVYVITDKHVIEARQHELTKNWNADWSPTYVQLSRPEWVNRTTDTNKFGVKIVMKEPRGGVLHMFGSSKPKGKIVLFETEQIARRVYERMLAAWEAST